MLTDAVALSSTDLCRMTDATFRQLDYWARCGLLEPSVSVADGCGSRRRYTHRDAQVAHALAVVARSGILVNSQCSCEIAALVREHGLRGVFDLSGPLSIDLSLIDDPLMR